MKNYLILILMVASLTEANAQMSMTTENRSLGPGTYEEATNGLSPPSDGYRKGWQTSKPGTSMSYGGATGTVPLPNTQNDVPDE